MPLKPGFVLRNRYRIESVLGQGGMGAVYKSVDVNLGVTVAVKENLFTTEEFARQFRREATILASLRHPNLPRVTDHFVVEGEGQYLVMDFVQGDDLRQRLERNGPVREDEALPWFLDTCDALAYLHGARRPSCTATSSPETSRSRRKAAPCWSTSGWPRWWRKTAPPPPAPRR